MKLLTAALLLTAVASAQDTPANPLFTVSKNIYAISKNDVLGSVDKIPDDMWSFQPTKDVRTVAQLFAHIADGQYEFCGVVAEGKSVSKNIEKTLKTKAEIVPALKEAFAYCDATYAKLTDANAAELVSFFGMRITKLGAMDFNTAHNMEHYGNLVTYMRINGIVPPSSEPRKPAASGKK
ncbi:MAG: DinB family protein [Bryobacteraceae bacterium]